MDPSPSFFPSFFQPILVGVGMVEREGELDEDREERNDKVELGVELLELRTELE